MTAREEAIRKALLKWAGRLDLPVTVKQIVQVTAAIDRSIQPFDRPAAALDPRGRHTCTPKPGSSPDDARRIARRLDATWPTSN